MKKTKKPAKKTRGGYACPECLNPTTRVVRTIRRSTGLARVRRCPECKAETRTTETHLVGAAYAQKRISITDLVKLAETSILDSDHQPQNRSEGNK